MTDFTQPVDNVTPYFCSYYKKDITSYETCRDCVQWHEGGKDLLRCTSERCRARLEQEPKDYISCRYCCLKYNPRVRTILPKDFKFNIRDYLKSKKTLLVIRKGGGLGDLLMITPTLRALKKNYPRLKIIFKAAPQYQPLLYHNPYIDELIGLGTQVKPDAVIDLSNPCPAINYELRHNPNVDKGRIDLFAQPAGITLSDGDKDLVYVVTNQEKRQARATLRGLGVKPRTYKVGFGLRSNEIKRDWELRKYSQLADMIGTELGGAVFGFHSVVTEFDAANAFLMYGRPIREVAALMSLMDLFVGSDSGLIHLAAAVGVPIVGIFGPIDPECRLSSYKNAVWVDKVEEVCPFERCWYSFPCKEVPGKCIQAITTEEVLEKIEQLRESNA